MPLIGVSSDELGAVYLQSSVRKILAQDSEGRQEPGLSSCSKLSLKKSRHRT